MNFYKPTSLIVDTTIICNQKCYFCWRENEKSYLNDVLKDKNSVMSFDICKLIIDNACNISSLNMFSICGPMGEPLANPNCFYILKYAMSKNHFDRVLINTNGTLINRYDPYDILSSLTDINVSVDSINPLTYEKIHGNAKQLPIVLENINRLLDCKKQYNLKTNIRVRFTENKYNQKEFTEFKKYFDSINCEILHVKIHSFNGINPNENSEWEHIFVTNHTIVSILIIRER